ncbi:tetratricopeptide repeat domain 39B [Willisornis vidua]|uniref:Tetratricopeptide repeat protein 39B n=1 Tax=Willisornis vidua TaxID=1566151 RepID=A0ABQ9CUR5_9PASS|nr:tetratricopeptide repeat domain 39B [Willisornis vidua]
MDLKCALEECSMALNLFLNNKFSEALELLRPWSKDSMYHALGYSTILVMQAAMTFEHQDIQMGISTMKEALQTCQRFRKRSSVVESLSNLVSKQAVDQLSEEEMHAEICYAECLLQKAALTFVQTLMFEQSQYFDHNLKTKLDGRKWRITGVFCEGKLTPKTSIETVGRGTGEANLQEAESLLEPYLQKFPNGSIILFYAARIDILKGNFEKAQLRFQDCIAAQQEWKQIHHLCYWELMWCYTFQQDWLQAYRYADLLSKESRWSKAIYVFQKAAILCMLPEDDLKRTGENIVSLFRQVDGLKQRIAGKSIPTEKFAVRKARRYASSQPVKLILPALEMMYVWNGFAVVGKRADLTENLLVTIEKEEIALQNETNHNEYYMDDVCMLQLLKGLCLKHLGRLMQAELCFSKVIQSEKQIKYDSYLVPFTLYELGLLYKHQDEREKAIRYIETAKNNYKEYSMESRLHFRIHAALDSLKVSPASTP